MVWRIKRTDTMVLGTPTDSYVSQDMPETLGVSTKIVFETNITKAKELSTELKATTLMDQIHEKYSNDVSVVMIVEEVA